MAVLRPFAGGQDFELKGGRVLIGRDADCDLPVPMGLVSRRHAIVFQHHNRYFIDDLGSANGTYINGQRIHSCVQLKNNDRISIYGWHLTFIDEAQSELADSGQTMMASHSPIDVEPANIASWVDATSDPTGKADVAPATKLRAILEITRTIGAALDVKEILPRILDSLFAVFPHIDRGFVILPDERTGQLVARAEKHRHARTSREGAFSRTIVQNVLKTCRAVRIGDASKDSNFDPSHSIDQLKFQSILCVPMLGDDNRALGVIQLDSLERRSQFSDDDLDVLVIAASQATRAVELARLHQEKRDLVAATKIQKSFLPAERPTAPGLDFFDFYNPALHVGGDYYDYIPLPGNRLAITLGDVSGKGVSAALLMARMSSAARFYLATEPDPLNAVNRLNAFLANSDLDDRFVTFVAIVVDLATQAATMINAGHLAPLLCRRGPNVSELAPDTIGLPLAVLARPYQATHFTLEPDDVVALYTDGVTEARNPGGQLYGAERLMAAVRAAPFGVGSIGQAILADVRSYMAGRPQPDDLTIVCFGRPANV